MHPGLIVLCTLGSIIGLSTLISCLVFSRFKFRTRTRQRATTVDPQHEARFNLAPARAPQSGNQAQFSRAQDEDEEEDDDSVTNPNPNPNQGTHRDKVEKSQSAWLAGTLGGSGSWGLTPLAGRGPDGTRTFVNGWFGLDAPFSASTSTLRSSNSDDHDSRAQSNESMVPMVPESKLDPGPFGDEHADDGLNLDESRFSQASRASRRVRLQLREQLELDEAVQRSKSHRSRSASGSSRYNDTEMTNLP